MHFVLHVDDEKARKLSDKDVLVRWHKAFKGTELTNKYVSNEALNSAELSVLNKTIEKYRQRLFDISWFMRILNEDIARRANKEDGCKGRFWEGRFKSQALLDEPALAACMVYVDLNPVRAKMSKTLNDSKHTSINKRIKSVKQGKQPSHLFPFIENNKKTKTKSLPFDLMSYIQLVDITSQCIRQDKRGHIKVSHALLENLHISEENWLTLTTKFTRIFRGAVGREKIMQTYCDHLNRRRLSNLTQCRRYLS